MMTYRNLIEKLERYNEDIDVFYTVRNMTVDECFESEKATNKKWGDLADDDSIQEVKQEIKERAFRY